MEHLSQDLLLFVQNILNEKNDKLNMTRINKNISTQLINNIKTKISIIDKLLTDINFKYKLNEHFNDNVYGTLYTYTNLYLCSNNECINKNSKNSKIPFSRMIFSRMMLGRTCFYYPKNLIKNHDYVKYPNLPNIEKIKRYRQCKNGKCVYRMIPYCYDCTIKYVNYGKIDDNKYSVPFSTKNGEYLF